MIAACGAVIILLSAGSALLPVVEPGAGVTIVGSLLFVAGMVEAFAGTLHRQAKGLATLAGAVTMLAGLMFIFNPAGRFFPTALVVAGWLIVRSVILMLAGRHSIGSVRMWTLLSAAMDFILAVGAADGIVDFVTGGLAVRANGAGGGGVRLDIGAELCRHRRDAARDRQLRAPIRRLTFGSGQSSLGRTERRW